MATAGRLAREPSLRRRNSRPRPSSAPQPRSSGQRRPAPRPTRPAGTPTTTPRQLVGNAKKNADQIAGQAKTQAGQLLAEVKADAERRRAATQREVDDLTRQKDSIASHLAQASVVSSPAADLGEAALDEGPFGGARVELQACLVGVDSVGVASDS